MFDDTADGAPLDQCTPTGDGTTPVCSSYDCYTLWVSPGTIKNIETILRSVGRDPRAAAAGWRSTDPFVVACLLAASGFPVFPCTIFKTPMIKHGVNASTTDLKTICYWGRDWAFRGWCVRTGRYDSRSGGLWILDVDDAAGYRRLAELEAELGPLPKTWKVMSPRPGGGEHHYFAPCPDGPDMKMRAGALINGRPGQIDQKGRGGYAVGAGSLNYKSQSRYYWAEDCAPDETPLASLPPAWVEAIEKADTPTLRVAGSSSSRKSMRGLKQHQGGTLLGDGDPDVYGGFQNPTYIMAIRYFFAASVEAPHEPIIEAIRELIVEAPKRPDRGDVSRYLSGPDLPRIVERAWEFVVQVKEEERVEY